MLETKADYIPDPFEHRLALHFAETVGDDHFDASQVFRHTPPVPSPDQLRVEWGEP